MLREKIYIFDNIISLKELKILLGLFFVASLLLNIYFLFQQNSPANAQCVSANFVYCINGKCYSQKLTSAQIRQIQEKINDEIQAAEAKIKEMEKVHQKIMQTVWNLY